MQNFLIAAATAASAAVGPPTDRANGPREYAEYRLDKRLDHNASSVDRAAAAALAAPAEACRGHAALCELERALGGSSRWWDGTLATAVLPRLEREGDLARVLDASLRACRQRRSCPHVYGHNLGRALALLTAHGADPAHELSAIALCGKNFQLGCFHGAVQGSVLRAAVGAAAPPPPLDVRRGLS